MDGYRSFVICLIVVGFLGKVRSLRDENFIGHIGNIDTNEILNNHRNNELDIFDYADFDPEINILKRYTGEGSVNYPKIGERAPNAPIPREPRPNEQAATSRNQANIRAARIRDRAERRRISH